MANVKSSGFRKKAASLLAAAALALFPSPGRSYEPGTVGNPSTHPLLSRKSAELYMDSPHHEEDPNGRRINIRDLEKGTIEEDSPPYRSVHHFMEWNTGRGLDPIISAKEWALDEEAQTAFWGGNYTWPRAVREQDVESLGHILHLIQDLSVPAHTRDDAHPGFFSKLEDADSELERELILALNPNHEDSYELWAHENRGKISQLTPETVPYYNRLEDIFDHMANVSGSLFLSDDTTFETGKYPSPRGGDVTARRIAGRQYYMANIARKEVPLARKGFLREYVLDHYVLNEQWRILGTKAVEMGAAAIQLYFESIGEENPDQPECIPRERLECIDRDVYLVDGCGLQDVVERCQEGQTCEGGECRGEGCDSTRNCRVPNCVFHDDFYNLNSSCWDFFGWIGASPGGDISVLSVGPGASLQNKGDFPHDGCRATSLEYRARFIRFREGDSYVISYGFPRETPTAGFSFQRDHPGQFVVGCTEDFGAQVVEGWTIVEGFDVTQWHTVRMEHYRQGAKTISVNGLFQRQMACTPSPVFTLSNDSASPDASLEVDYVTITCEE